MQLTQKQIDYCMECGVCTGSCPVSRELPLFSPRQMIKRALLESEADLLQGPETWACLSCARCCGHDAFWSGDEDTFRKLAQLNLDVIRSSGAKTVLFSCPEGYFTFKQHYPEYVGDLPFEVSRLAPSARSICRAPSAMRSWT